jgi:transcriptional regulator with XRE-family HTH domain
MARKVSRAWRKAMGITITPQKGCWIKFQLNLRNITYKTVAQKANVSEVMITQFIKGRKNSEKVRRALAETLGYPSFEALIAASRGHDGGTV